MTQGKAIWNLSDPSQWEVPFGVIPDGQYHVYYVPLFPFKLEAPILQLNLTQMRLNPIFNASIGQTVDIDWIRVIRGKPALRIVVVLSFSICFGNLSPDD